MTLPSTGPLKASDIRTELSQTGSLNIGSATARALAGVASGTIKYSDFRGRASFAAGNSGVITTAGAGSYTLPYSSGSTIKALVIAGGGGGGGGTARMVNTGAYSGGGGGAAGIARYIQFTATPGSTIYFTIGAGGIAGGPRDGGYSLGTEAGSGGGSVLTYNNVNLVGCPGGTNGGISQYQGYGVGGTNSGGYGGTLINTTLNGQTVYYAPSYQTDYDNYGGGWGPEGVLIDTTVGAATVYSLGARGIGGWGNYPYWYVGRSPIYITPRLAVTGTGYGGGGSGGGKDNEYAGYDQGIYGSAGNSGAVFFWWGY